MNRNISVIMPVLLSKYDGQTKNPRDKFIRAVESFLNQTYHNKELVIIADGCNETIDIAMRKWKKEIKEGLIVLVELPPRKDGELFVGSTRQRGIDHSNGDILCNLDADDYFLPNHLHNLDASFNTDEFDWAYFNLYRKLDIFKDIEELVDIQPNLDSLCTASVAWKRELNVTWVGADGRQDNKVFNKQLLNKYPKKQKLYGLGYVVANATVNYVKLN